MGPSPSHARKGLGTFVGWYAMERVVRTLKAFCGAWRYDDDVGAPAAFASSLTPQNGRSLAEALRECLTIHRRHTR